jgi:hypothetical protein
MRWDEMRLDGMGIARIDSLMHWWRPACFVCLFALVGGGCGCGGRKDRVGQGRCSGEGKATGIWADDNGVHREWCLSGLACFVRAKERVG